MVIETGSLILCLWFCMMTNTAILADYRVGNLQNLVCHYVDSVILYACYLGYRMSLFLLCVKGNYTNC